MKRIVLLTLMTLSFSAFSVGEIRTHQGTNVMCQAELGKTLPEGIEVALEQESSAEDV